MKLKFYVFLWEGANLINTCGRDNTIVVAVNRGRKPRSISKVDSTGFYQDNEGGKEASHFCGFGCERLCVGFQDDHKFLDTPAIELSKAQSLPLECGAGLVTHVTSEMWGATLPNLWGWIRRQSCIPHLVKFESMLSQASSGLARALMCD